MYFPEGFVRGPLVASKNYLVPTSMLTCTIVRYSKSYMYIAELSLDSYGTFTRNSALHDLMLNKRTIARFVGTDIKCVVSPGCLRSIF